MTIDRRFVNNKLLRFGYTTGTCAAAASAAACRLLLMKEAVPMQTIQTPKGVPVSVEILNLKEESGIVTAVFSDGTGGDPGCDARTFDLRIGRENRCRNRNRRRHRCRPRDEAGARSARRKCGHQQHAKADDP